MDGYIWPCSSADVIDLSSGEDDAVVAVSSESPTEEEDTELCGVHANDALNRPDAQGRVLVNVNHPDTDPDIFLSPHLARSVQPHQVQTHSAPNRDFDREQG